MSSILRGNDNLDSSNLATDTELSTALAGKANTIVANDSQIKTALNASGTAPIYACRAWVNFNGTGTVAIRASGNVSSITDNGTGDYTVSFTTAMSDANYLFNGTGTFNINDGGGILHEAMASATSYLLKSSTQIRCENHNNNADGKVNGYSCNVTIFR